MKPWLIIGGVLAVIVVSAGYFRTGQPDLRPHTDGVVQGLMERSDHQDAITFLEAGGQYGGGTAEGLMQPVVLPILRRLQAETGLSALVVVDESGHVARALVIALPDDPADVRQLKEFFLREDRDFDGVILHQYGRQWMHFDFINEQYARSMNLHNWEAE